MFCGVTAIARSAFVLDKRALVDLTTGLIALPTLVLVRAAKKASEPFLILGAGIAGFLLFKGPH
jgi:hypothetical protein